MRRALGSSFGVLAAFAVMVAMPASAFASFPGRNGLLVVQPRHSQGVLLVRADGSQRRVICAGGRCRGLLGPRWSPDGREIVGAGDGVRIVYPDGSCLDCAFGAASNPAFEAGGWAVSFVVGGAVFEDGIDGLRETNRVLGSASDVVWASTGEVAVVRRGVVWAGWPGRLRRVAPGAAPSWSPRASELAISAGGWIVIIDLRSHKRRRVVRGSAPAFSPDGRLLAFVDAKDRLLIVPLRGAHRQARQVGRVRAVTVDWQPLPARRVRGCVAPPGSVVLASSRKALITGEGAATRSSYGAAAFTGCLRSDGRLRALERLPDTNINDTYAAYSVAKVALHAPYVALVNFTADLHYGADAETVAMYDLRTGRRGGHGGEWLQCEGGGDLCAAFNQVAIGHDGVSAAYAGFQFSGGGGSDPLHVIACPTAGLCLSSGSGGLDFSTSPAVGPWTSNAFGPHRLHNLLCPTTTLCLGTSGSSIYSSVSPTRGGFSAWHATQLSGNPFLGAPACASVSLCMIPGDAGHLFVSADPTGGPTAWTQTDPSGAAAIAAIACPSSNECIATDTRGDVLASSNPLSGTWSSHHALPSAAAELSCPSSSFCVVATLPSIPGPPAGIFVSSDPTAGAWTDTVAGPAAKLNALSCPSITLCVAVGPDDSIQTSSDPASGVWTRSTVPGAGDLSAVSCPSTTFCVAGGDGDGYALVSDNPTGGASAWTRVLADPVICPSWASGCGTEQIIASDRGGIHTLDTSTEFLGQTPAQLTSMTLAGDTLSWNHGSTHRRDHLEP